MRVETTSTRMWGRLTPASLMLLLVLFLGSQQGFAQSQSLFSLYRFNPQVLTPTNAGFNSVSSVTVMYRNQWAGLEGAPRTFGATGNFKWGENKGIGANLLVDEAGPMKLFLLQGDFAYHASLNEQWRFTGGIRAGVGNLSLNFDGRLIDPTDPAFSSSRSTGVSPVLGWGIQLAKVNNGFYFSFSQPRMTKFSFGDKNGGFQDVAHNYAMVGTKVELGEKVQTARGAFSQITLYPSVLLRFAKDVPTSTDLNLNANLRGLLDLGLGLRAKESYGIRLGVQATNKVYLGYIYEVPTSNLSRLGSASHELALRFNLSRVGDAK